MNKKHVTRRDLATLLDVHMQTVTKWERDGLPIAERGRRGKPSRYSVTDVRAWLKAREDAARNGTQLDAAQERARKDRALALLNEQLYKVRDGELLQRDEVRQKWAKEVMGARAVLLSLPLTYAAKIHRAATQDGEAGVERALKDAVKEVLRELADLKRGASAKPRRARKKKKTIRKKKGGRRKK